MKKIFLLLFLSSCCIGSKYTPPCPDMPCAWHSPQDGMETEPSFDNSNWWEAFDDPLLTWLIEQASEQNIDLFIAATRILEARAERKGKFFDYLPHIDGSLTAGHLTYNKKGILHKVIDCASHRHNIDFFEAGFDACWEIDFFGKTAHEIRASQARLEAMEESYCDLWLTLSAEIARNYIELRTLQKRLVLLNDHIIAKQDAIHLTEELLRIGSLSSIDLHQVREQLHLLESKKPLLEFAIAKTINRLSVLLGCHPGALFEELCGCQELPQLPIYTPIGVPSDLLRRRPDIKRAERTLAAANEEIGKAMAALFPSFSLKGFIGGINSHLPSLFHPESFVFFIAPQILAPIFNSKMLQQDVCYNQLKAEEACFEYQKVVLNALEESENAIASFHYEWEHNQSLADGLQASQETYELAQDLFARGIKSYLEVLPLFHAYLEAKEAHLQSEANLLSNYIALYKALGGGFFCEESN